MSHVTVETEGRVARVTLNDPDKRNAITQAINDELVAALDELESDPGIGALVVTGAGRAFCAGADLSDLLAARETGITGIYEGFLRVAHSPLATVAAVNGAAVGAGMNLVLACDLVLAGRRQARFDSRFLRIGLHPGGGHTWRLRHVTDRSTTMAMVLFGEVLSAEQAQHAGLAYRAVDDGELLESAHELAARAAATPRELLARTKATILSLDEIQDSATAVEHELHPQLWSMDQPAFTDLVQNLQSRIASAGEHAAG
ncbi:MAG: enoyl-CoA hydratase-related protein [Acidimicrobiaceae bacterium]|nr:enoyl-CoA hydratase-related protein [Acidimicrobiaceae bacterium]